MIPGVTVTEVETVTFCGDVPVATKSLSSPVAVFQTAIGTSSTVKMIAYSSIVPLSASVLQVPYDMDIAARESRSSLSNMTVGVGVFTST
jgi:hypothetical protein